mmetsp:Transcript_17627/g.16864  ORF Transcript_17627/g.16864 Transcript_17627/m.16864 type:complete len:92 (+) Transcript_17627:318-593(+)
MALPMGNRRMFVVTRYEWELEEGAYLHILSSMGNQEMADSYRKENRQEGVILSQSIMTSNFLKPLMNPVTNKADRTLFIQMVASIPGGSVP